MNGPRRKHASAKRRRYLIHLFCLMGADHHPRTYVARIHPWTARRAPRACTQERVFADEYELTKILNPLLPRGSDVRDVLDLIESAEGFFYLLSLNIEQAGKLGWDASCPVKDATAL